MTNTMACMTVEKAELGPCMADKRTLHLFMRTLCRSGICEHADGDACLLAFARLGGSQSLPPQGLALHRLQKQPPASAL